MKETAFNLRRPVFLKYFENPTLSREASLCSILKIVCAIERDMPMICSHRRPSVVETKLGDV